MSDPQFFLKAFVHLVCPAQHAADVGAHLHVVLARRLEAKHGIVGCHIAHFELGDADALSYFGNHRI